MSVSVAPRTIPVEVARANAAYRIELYLKHADRCPVTLVRRCPECERLGLDLMTAERHRARLETAS